MMQKGFSLLIFFLVVFAFVLVGGYSTGITQTNFLKGFLESFWGQSSWLVPPSWAVVYGLVAISGWSVWNGAEGLERIFPMMLFGAVLTANATWWWIYFEWGDPNLALMNLGLLWGLIFFTICVFFIHSRFGAALMIPYFAWISYALVFNFFKLKF